jgi:catechol 2,3-dioxygenase-like lactoylglutathione lyase family enzyme
MLSQGIGSITYVVRDYDEAIAYFTERLRFRVIEDTPLGGDKRWVRVGPPSGGTALLLAKAASPEQKKRVGDQTGGRVFLFLYTDDFRRDYAEMKARGIEFIEEPREEEYGTVCVFKDLYGNKWDFIQSSTTKSPPPRREERSHEEVHRLRRAFCGRERVRDQPAGADVRGRRRGAGVWIL